MYKTNAIKSHITTAIALSAIVFISSCQQASKSPVEVPDSKMTKPNIVLIFADDTGYGDLQTYNTESKIPTPNLNALAAQGMSFTDAHTSSAVCTPSRYSLLTGRYAWRTRLKQGVLNGNSPLLIDTARETLPSLLKRAGYHTMMVGKWHLGIGEGTRKDKTNYDKPLSHGPNAIGFDYFYGIPASLDFEPYVLIENEQLATPLLGATTERQTHKRKGGKGFWRNGRIGEGFVHEDILPNLADKAVAKIKTAAKADDPFFLYLPLPSPHTPWLPTEKFIGTSKAGAYGDFSAQTDHVVGQVLAALKNAGIEENTLVIYSSDNGAHWLPSDIEKFGHLANGSWRGQKGDIHEAGHRVPLIIKWPGKVPEKSTSDARIVLNDILPTLATFTNIAPAADTAPDSVDFSQVLLADKHYTHDRSPIIHHSFRGRFAIRIGDWKLIEGIGSGGMTPPQNVTPEPGQSPYELYNLAQDPAETNNLADKQPQRVKQMLTALNGIRDNGA